jgi:hypothetical protein
MKGVKKVICILVRIISIARMNLFMLPKANKLDHFAYKMGLQISFIIKKGIITSYISLNFTYTCYFVFNK